MRRGGRCGSRGPLVADPVWIVELDDAATAERCCARLRAAGIKCNFLQSPKLTPPFPLLGRRKDRWYVFVDPADAVRGRELFAASGLPPLRS